MPYLTVGETAARLGVSTQRVHQLIWSGQLSAERVGRTWMIDSASVREREARHPRAGRPKAVSPLSQSYTLMNRTHEVLSFRYDPAAGRFFDSDAVFDPQRAPLGLLSPRGASASGAALRSWWRHRAIPASREGIDAKLAEMGLSDPSEIPFASLGLSLSDQYWVRPHELADVRWEDVNFFDNAFGSFEPHSSWLADVGLRSPDNTSEGMLPKRWICEGKSRLLLKGGGALGQEPCNEVVATELHRRVLNAGEYVEYELREHNGETVCASRCFVRSDEEYVPAFQIENLMRRQSHHSEHQHVLECCARLGIANAELSLAKMIITDDLLANTDRHLRNFGIVRNVETLECRMAPLFDTGSCLWCNASVQQLRGRDFSYASKPFYDAPARQLRLAGDFSWLDLSALEGLPEQAARILSRSELSEERLALVAEGIRFRIDRLTRILS